MNPARCPDGCPIPSHNAMDMRDYFAAAVLPAVYRDADKGVDLADVAIEAYSLADAMLAERSKP